MSIILFDGAERIFGQRHRLGPTISEAGMLRYVFHTLDVFTDRIFGGNPLAVFPNSVGLETERMQAVARELYAEYM